MIATLLYAAIAVALIMADRALFAEGPRNYHIRLESRICLRPMGRLTGAPIGVGMGSNAATKLRRVVQNVQRVLAIELLTAAQALELRRPHKSSPALEKTWVEFRKEVSFMAQDEVLHDKLISAEQFLNKTPN